MLRRRGRPKGEGEKLIEKNHGRSDQQNMQNRCKWQENGSESAQEEVEKVGEMRVGNQRDFVKNLRNKRC